MTEILAIITQKLKHRDKGQGSVLTKKFSRKGMRNLRISEQSENSMNKRVGSTKMEPTDLNRRQRSGPCETTARSTVRYKAIKNPSSRRSLRKLMTRTNNQKRERSTNLRSEAEEVATSRPLPPCFAGESPDTEI